MRAARNSCSGSTWQTARTSDPTARPLSRDWAGRPSEAACRMRRSRAHSGLGDKFYDQDIRPLQAVRRDSVGRHDTFALVCTGSG
ncbi:MAG: DUF1989 domain-containing protein [Sedimentitalea sp.]|uniref:DUF1989 domain-containing protein n=1 Tax=Sedimentitalea sp. TaxID=2048915 RepID=UPI0032641274